MAKKTLDKSESDYVKRELEFLSAIRQNEPVIALITEDNELWKNAVEWLRTKLKCEIDIIGISLERHSVEFYKKLDPDILIGDSLNDFFNLIVERPLNLMGDRSYIYFKKSASEVNSVLGLR